MLRFNPAPSLRFGDNKPANPDYSISYDNTGQVFNSGSAITNMTPTPDPIGALNFIYYQAWGLPTGLSINSYTGVISGTPTTVDEYAVVVRGTFWGAYTGYTDTSLNFNVVSGSPTIENYLYVDTGFTTPPTNTYGDYFNHFDNTKYTAGQSLLNLVDEANAATGIDLTNVAAWDGESNSTGTGYSGALDFLPAETTRDRFYLTSASTMELQFDVSGYTGWASKTYKVYGGGFRQFLGSEAAGAAEASTDNYSTQYDWSCAYDEIVGGADPADTVYP
jgi:hypothetical protein